MICIILSLFFVFGTSVASLSNVFFFSVLGTRQCGDGDHSVGSGADGLTVH